MNKATKYVQDLYTVNYIILLEEFKEDLNKWRDIVKISNLLTLCIDSMKLNQNPLGL